MIGEKSRGRREVESRGKKNKEEKIVEEHVKEHKGLDEVQYEEEKLNCVIS